GLVLIPGAEAAEGGDHVVEADVHGQHAGGGTELAEFALAVATAVHGDDGRVAAVAPAHATATVDGENEADQQEGEHENDQSGVVAQIFDHAENGCLPAGAEVKRSCRRASVLIRGEGGGGRSGGGAYTGRRRCRSGR